MIRFLLPFVLLSSALAAEELPRVLFLGDPLHGRIYEGAARELKEEASLLKPPASRSLDVAAYDSGSALARIDELLGEGGWDLIYFNFGLADLFYKDPSTKEIRAMSKNAGGVRVADAEQYRANLEAIVARLKESDAKLLWGTTTPMVKVNTFPSYRGNLYDADSELEYNRIAAEVMKRHNVPVVDLHAHIIGQFGPEEQHPGYEGYEKVLAKKVPAHTLLVKAIQQGLKS